MRLRTLAITAAFATASVVALTSPASAQTYGGVTLSFGSGGYDGYGYDYDPYSRGTYYTYVDPRLQQYRYYEPGYRWRARERREQIEQWREDQQRRRYWAHERREHRQWRDDDDDDD
jgi:hypothetical protein